MLTLQELKTSAPAVFTTDKASRCSERYQQASTLQAIEALSKEGWQPVKAEQKRTRNGQGLPYAKHLVRLRHESARGIFSGGQSAVGQAFPEIVLLNSHNGTGSYKLMAGIFVLACSNGLVVAEETLGSITLRHTPNNKDAFKSAAEKISHELKPVIKRIDGMRNRKMVEKEKLSFASSALALRFPANNAPFQPQQLLIPRREADKRNDLWAVFNVVQENLMAGGTTGKTASGRQFTSVPTRDINMKLKYNQALWSLADGFLEAKKN